jgi:DNA-binding PadR family transcriptional regulator
VRETGGVAWAILAVMSDGLPKTHRQITTGCRLVFAEHDIERSTLSRAIHRLEELGLIATVGDEREWGRARYQISDMGYDELSRTLLILGRMLWLSVPGLFEVNPDTIPASVVAAMQSWPNTHAN